MSTYVQPQIGLLKVRNAKVNKSNINVGASDVFELMQNYCSSLPAINQLAQTIYFP